jgi:undecaprenyl-diphosphatase
VLISGFLAAQGVFDLDALIVVIVSASIIGDSINYWLGRYVGRPYSIMSDGGL